MTNRQPQATWSYIGGGHEMFDHGACGFAGLRDGVWHGGPEARWWSSR